MELNQGAASLSQDIISRYKQEISSWRRSAARWVREEDSATRLLIFRRVQEAQRRLMKELFVLGGNAWERQQAWKELRSSLSKQHGYDAREYRMAVAADGRFAASEQIYELKSFLHNQQT